MDSEIVKRLINWSLNAPDKSAFIFLEDGEDKEKKVTFLELRSKMDFLSSKLLVLNRNNKRALLVYNDVSEFIVAFLACLSAGVIAVPIYFSKGQKHTLRFISVLEDAQVSVILTTASLYDHVVQLLSNSHDFSGIEIMPTDGNYQPDGLHVKKIDAPSAVAFIQYTSGSTGFPKGVMISNKNLNHNQSLIQKAFNCTEDSILFSWLPFYHDMGLIGNILHTLYVGSTCILMSPYHFIESPGRWLKAISKYKVTHSGGPNFAYDLCTGNISPAILPELDLSSWKVAYNGAEPLKSDTLTRFSEFFKSSGFKPESFYPCYGLAEATLFVAGFKDINRAVKRIYINPDHSDTGKIELTNDQNPVLKVIVGSGRVADEMDLRIINYKNHTLCSELEEGEICLAGESITGGYWNKNNENVFHKISGVRYLRTGDLGFMYEGELFVHGRLKEMLIIRGENYYPYDIEDIVSATVDELVPNGVAVFSAGLTEDEFVVVAEIRRDIVRAGIDLKMLILNIEDAIANAFSIVPHDIILVHPFSIPKTSSGKLQRLKCSQYYQEGKFRITASKLNSIPVFNPADDTKRLLNELINNPGYTTISNYLIHMIELKTGRSLEISALDQLKFTELGIDSLRIMELVNHINRDLSINLDISYSFQNDSLSDVITSIENILWLKNEQTSGEDIII